MAFALKEDPEVSVEPNYDFNMGCGGSKAINNDIAPADPGIEVLHPVPNQGNRKIEAVAVTRSDEETSAADENRTVVAEGDLITRVQETWRSVKEAYKLEHIGLEFYLRLFTDSPELLQLFSFSDIDLSNEAARNDKRLTRQGRVTMEHLDLAVSSLNNLGSIVPALKELGARHVMYKVEEHHYEPVGAALLKTLHNGLGERFTPEVREAWTQVYKIVADTMKAGAKELQDAKLT